MVLSYSHEGRDLRRAGDRRWHLPRLELLCPQSSPSGGHGCLVLAGDVCARIVLRQIQSSAFRAGTMLAHLWLVPNPEHNPRGDFGLTPARVGTDLSAMTRARFTYSTISLYRRLV